MRTLIIALALCAAQSTAQAQYRGQSTLVSASQSARAALTISSATPQLRFLLPDCDVDRTRGKEIAASTHSGSGWMLGGVASGVILGLIGTAIITVAASSSGSQVERIPDGVEPSCFRDGYSSKVKSMNTSNALTGGLLGTAVLILIVVSATSGSSY